MVSIDTKRKEIREIRWGWGFCIWYGWGDKNHRNHKTHKNHKNSKNHKNHKNHKNDQNQKDYGLKLIVINNNGGGIFKELPIANTPEFEQFFKIIKEYRKLKQVWEFDS